MDNPSAFPTSIYNSGMTLRDYFAGQALIGILTNDRVRHFTQESGHERDLNMRQSCAIYAYEFADAMLAARSKGQDNG